MIQLKLCSKKGQHKAINDEGMPQHGRSFMKGRLFVEFNVEFPESGALSPDQCRALEKVLPEAQGSIVRHGGGSVRGDHHA
jgi:DnaJ family protein A protein 2